MNKTILFSTINIGGFHSYSKEVMRDIVYDGYKVYI